MKHGKCREKMVLARQLFSIKQIVILLAFWRLKIAFMLDYFQSLHK